MFARLNTQASTRVAFLASLALFPAAVSAQRLTDARASTRIMPAGDGTGLVASTDQTSTAGLVAGGILGAVVVAGVVYAAATNCDQFECVLPILVTSLLAPVAIPAGVHLANERRGRLRRAVALSYLVTALWIGAGTLAEHSGGRAWPVYFTAIPLTQLIVSIRTERRTARAQRPDR